MTRTSSLCLDVAVADVPISVLASGFSSIDESQHVTGKSPSGCVRGSQGSLCGSGLWLPAWWQPWRGNAAAVLAVLADLPPVRNAGRPQLLVTHFAGTRWLLTTPQAFIFLCPVGSNCSQTWMSAQLSPFWKFLFLQHYDFLL